MAFNFQVVKIWWGNFKASTFVITNSVGFVFFPTQYHFNQLQLVSLSWGVRVGQVGTEVEERACSFLVYFHSDGVALLGHRFVRQVSAVSFLL